MAGFVDQAQLHARAGDGGAGAVSWRREAHVDRGGPDGGDGGHGGDVWLVASVNQSSLLGFRDHPFRRATDGGHGSGQKKHGARGKDIVVPVPVGTVVRDADGAVQCDLAGDGDRFLIAEGGQGGRGNARFLSNRRRAPAFAEQGEKGQERWLDMELKLMADVALVGFPNAGKSTLISTVSAAKPKIADYPFTTLEPQLGVVTIGDAPYEESYIVADIPGLIEGAHLGAGLGTQFLRHIERTRILIHLVDVSDSSGRPDPVEDFKVIMEELKSFGHGLDTKPMIVVASKADVANPAKLKKLETTAKRKKLPFYAISAVTGQGVDKLKYAIGDRVRELRAESAAIELKEPASAVS
jgi:GTPase